MKQFSRSPMSWLRAAFAVLALGLMASVAHADALDDARASGQIGEVPDGYVAAVQPNPSADIQQLITQINAERRKFYQKLAGEKGVPVEEVAALAAEKTISQRLKPGMFYMNSSGQWVQK